MMKKKKAVFKPYSQNQGLLLPPSLDQLIPQEHLVRIVNRVVDSLNLDLLLNKYQGGGTSSYHPRMMLKTWVFGYVMKVHSCRKVAKALREHIPFMWLSGMQQPDFRTLNDFRTKRMKEVIDDVFKQVVLFCVEEKYIDLSTLFTDGTKYQANGNKHKAIWKKNTIRHKESLLGKLDELLAEIDEENEAENKKYGNKDLEETGSHTITNSTELNRKIRELGEKINEEQQDKQKKKKIQKTIKEIDKQAKKLAKYESQEAALAGRNSYNKTDKDATMMRSKDDQLLPCYNIQNSCQNQIIVHYTVGQNANDATEFKTHLETIPEVFKPRAMLADSIYGTELNYELLEKNNITNYLMFPSFHAEQKPTFGKKIFLKENFTYNSTADTYTCPNAQILTLKWEGTIIPHKSTTPVYQKHYQAENCKECPFYQQCCKGKNNRIIIMRPLLERYKQQARTNLTSAKGVQLRKQRGVDVETPFADIKHNQGHRRLELRGIQKVNVEVGWINLAHNMKKINTFMKKAA
jgi:transposase